MRLPICCCWLLPLNFFARNLYNAVLVLLLALCMKHVYRETAGKTLAKFFVLAFSYYLVYIAAKFVILLLGIRLMS